MSRFQRFLNQCTDRVAREMMLEDIALQARSLRSEPTFLKELLADTVEKGLEQVLADLRRQGNQQRAIRILLRHGRTRFDPSEWYDEYEHEERISPYPTRTRLPRRRGRHAQSGGAFGKLR